MAKLDAPRVLARRLRNYSAGRAARLLSSIPLIQITAGMGRGIERGACRAKRSGGGFAQVTRDISHLMAACA
ncbi:hypothetical protein Z947_2019 [Sulfitobacter geojensis]|nr:hypothetical protein Z947_2019 [Sulfitobacter geojensis]